MRPSEVRQRVLDDHATLRGILVGIESLAVEVINGERRNMGALRLEAEELLAFLLAHMHWEELHLVPALREADAWGEERERLLLRDHQEQREMLRHILESVQDPSRPALVVARKLNDLVQLLREDMDDEERAFLDADILRDDVTAINAEAG